MKYAFKNFLRIFQNDRLIAVLAFLCIIASVIIMHFGYGLYQNFNALLIGEESGMSELEIKIQKGSHEVTKDKLLKCMKELSFDTDANINLITVFPAVSIETKEPTNQEKFYFPIHCYFSISNGIITSSKKLEKNLTNQGNLFGKYFSDNDFNSTSKVALFDRNVFQSKKKDSSFLREQIQFDDANAPMGYAIKIQGELYQIIGSLDGLSVAVIPITQLNDSTILQSSIFFRFGNDEEDSFITRAQYNDIRSTFQKHFGDAVSVPDIPLPDIDLQRLYRTVILIAGLIALIAGFNFAQLYLYILEKRKKRIAIMRICGCSRNGAAKMFLAECMMFMLPSYLLSYLAFRYGILPQCNEMFPFMADSFSPYIYLALFGIFIAVSVIELNVMILHFLAGNDLVGKERGR